MTVGQTRRIDTLSTLAACPLRSESDRRRSKCDPSLCASSGHAFALGDEWIVPSADYRAAVLDLPPRMARCASKSFATPQSCFISIKVVAVGQQTGTNVDCINTEFVGFLALVGFAGEKNAEGASGPRRGLTSQSSALLVR